MTLNTGRVAEFWAFVIERELIRQRRLAGLPREQWTSDPIFQSYRFTNVKREHDRTTTLLKREFYSLWRAHPSPVALLNATIFRYTGTIAAARRLGWSSDWSADSARRFATVIEAMQVSGEHPFTSAYVIPNCGERRPKHEVVADVVSSVWRRAEEILATESWQTACESMCETRGVGSFLAKEILLDYILATGWNPTDWETWTPVGPGGRQGAGYVLHGSVEPIREDLALAVIREIYSGRNIHWPATQVCPISGLRAQMPELDLTDIQFAACEVAKMMKARLGLRNPKRRFEPTTDDITCRKG